MIAYLAMLPGIRIIGVLGNNDGEKITLDKNFVEIGADLKAEFDERKISSSKFGIYRGTSEKLREAAIRSGGL